MLSKIKVVLDEGAKMPTKAHDTDAGFDLYAPKDFFVPRAEAYSGYGVEIGAIAIDTGVHIELPEGTVGMVKTDSLSPSERGCGGFGSTGR